MTVLELFALLIVLAAAFGFVNTRLLRLPGSIGILVLSLATSLLLIGFDQLVPQPHIRDALVGLLEEIDFSEALLNGALSFLLFAGAIEVSFGALWRHKWTVLGLATLGVLVSTALMGAAMWQLFQWLGSPVPFIWCLVFGAVVAPTDPVAVLGALQRAGLPRNLQATIAGESLFNDGVGVVVFTLLLGIATGAAHDLTVPSVAGEFLREALGGVALGLAFGYVAYFAMRRIDERHVELMISFALVTATYAIALRIGVSGPVAVVVAGLLIGSRGREYAMSEHTRRYLDTVWSVIDEILNALLFLLIGLEILVIEASWPMLVAAGLAAGMSLAVRFVSVLPMCFVPRPIERLWPTIGVLTWSGLRGGISIALALSLPASDHREAILTACYGIVLFTILVQGLTLERVVRRLFPAEET